MLFSNISGLAVYFFIRVLLYDFDFSFREDMITIFKTIAVAGAFAAVLYLVLIVADATGNFLQSKAVKSVRPVWIRIAVAGLVMLFTAFSGKTQPATGINIEDSPENFGIIK